MALGSILLSGICGDLTHAISTKNYENLWLFRVYNTSMSSAFKQMPIPSQPQISSVCRQTNLFTAKMIIETGVKQIQELDPTLQELSPRTT